jgi:D-3-phosphoglycerate dehydrogenase
METIDVDYAEQNGIVCLNSPEGNRDAVGEHTIGLLLALVNKMATANVEIRNGLWKREENRGIEIKGRTVGIIGFGNMGSSFAKRLQGFECDIISYDKYKTGYAPSYVEEVGLEELYSRADIVSFHIPLTDETHYMANESFFNSFAKPIYVLNTARGAVVKTVDLVEALKSGKVKGAALDVIEYEDMTKDGLDIESLTDDFRYLLSASNVLLTPHVGGWTVESKYKLAAVLADKIIDVLNRSL